MNDLSSEAQPGATPKVLLSYAEAQRRTTLSRSTIERLVRAKQFPEPIRITPSRFAFLQAEIERWIEDRLARRAGRRPNEAAA